MKNIILMIILIGIVVISNAVNMKIKSHEIIMQSERDISADYMQISATYLTSTNDLMPMQESQVTASPDIDAD
jgi:hypothetical protein